jgi:hypothetical protein
MAADTLKAARRMIEAGMPPKQAEAQAEVMAEAFVFNADSLVTKDYLDARLDARFIEQDARIDKRFAQVDARFTELEARMDKRFSEVDARFEVLSSEVNGKFKLVYWMLTVLILSTTVPAIRALFSA